MALSISLAAHPQYTKRIIWSLLHRCDIAQYELRRLDNSVCSKVPDARESKGEQGRAAAAVSGTAADPHREYEHLSELPLLSPSFLLGAGTAAAMAEEERASERPSMQICQLHTRATVLPSEKCRFITFISQHN